LASKAYRVPKVRAPVAREGGALRWRSRIQRGELYRVKLSRGDSKRSRVVVAVSRDAHLASRCSTVVCAPVGTPRGWLASEVAIGLAEGLKRPSAIMCDLLTSVPRAQLTDYVGTLGPAKLRALRAALRVALEID
jgi:mRNA-degrading endonuclease toxin of MazEF toxin-antitoxin module